MPICDIRASDNTVLSCKAWEGDRGISRVCGCDGWARLEWAISVGSVVDRRVEMPGVEGERANIAVKGRSFPASTNISSLRPGFDA